MAEIVLGVAASHSPQLGVPASQWSLMRQKDEHDTRMDYQSLAERMRRSRPNFEAEELTPELFQQRHRPLAPAHRW